MALVWLFYSWQRRSDDVRIGRDCEANNNVTLQKITNDEKEDTDEYSSFVFVG